MFRLISSDLLICDVILPLVENPQLLPLIGAYNQAYPEHPIAPGSKSPLSAEEFAQWQKVVGVHGKYMAGGSAANTLSALKKLLGNNIEIDFIAAYGDDTAGRVIGESLVHDGFNVLPQIAPFPDVQTAMSFVLVDKTGERSIAGYSGTSRTKIVPLQKKIPTGYDIIFLPGSLWQKYGAEFAQSLVGCGKKLWLSLPTHSQSGRQYNDAVRALIPKAHVVLANADELMRMFAVSSIESALEELQQQMGAEQIAFITHGVHGAFIVSREMIHPIAAQKISAAELKNTLGAGDAAFAGFLYGLLTDENNVERAGYIAMQLASAALQTESARLNQMPLILQ